MASIGLEFHYQRLKDSIWLQIFKTQQIKDVNVDRGITYLYGIDYPKSNNTFNQALLYDLVFKSTRLKYQRKKEILLWENKIQSMDHIIAI